MVCAIPIHPETAPRWETGTRSGTLAARPACIAFTPTCARHHPAAIDGMLCRRPTSSSAAAVPAAPPSTNGRRRPNLDVVRSDSAPASGFTIIATAAPRPLTQANATTRCAPATAWT